MNQRTSKRTTQKQRNKKQFQQRLIILLAITFVFGFLSGFFVGKNQEKEIQFVMTEPENESSQSNDSQKKTLDYESLPWNLKLVNFEHALDETFEPAELAEVDNGYVADSRIADATKKMIADARSKDNVRIIALSAYRDYDYQMELFENKVQRLQRKKATL